MVGMWKRLEKVERQLCPRHDDGCTLEELCRAIWRRDKQRFRTMHREDRLGYFIPQFEREDFDSRASTRGRFVDADNRPLTIVDVMRINRQRA
jgi:hypothetical protein